VDTGLVSAAQLVLEKRSDERGLQRADDLLSSLNKGETAAPMMDLPPPVPASTASTIATPPVQPSTPPAQPTNAAASSVDDDLDF